MNQSKPETADDSKRINPIKNFIANFNARNIRSQAVKRNRLIAWKYRPEDLEKEEDLKRVKADLKSQRKVQRLAIRGPNTWRFLGVMEKQRLCKDLFLTFGGMDGISDVLQKDDLRKSLKKMKFLHDLSINFYFCSYMKDADIKRLEDCFRHLYCLRYLALDFGYCIHITETGIKGLKHPNLLEELSLKFTRCIQIRDDWMKNFKEDLKPLHSLSRLNLEFSICENMTDAGLGHLKEGLEVMKSLQYLSLNFHRCENLTDVGLKHLTAVLKTFTSLRYFYLRFHFCDVTVEGIEFFKEGLKNCTLLNHLSLDFRSNKIPSDMKASLETSFRQDIPSLVHIKILC